MTCAGDWKIQADNSRCTPSPPLGRKVTTYIESGVPVNSPYSTYNNKFSPKYLEQQILPTILTVELRRLF